MIDYYQILDLAPHASADEVRAAYRELAEIYHPDRMQNLRPGVRKRAGDKLKLINEAYAVLREPGKRARYDAERQRAGVAPRHHGPPGPSTPPPPTSPQQSVKPDPPPDREATAQPQEDRRPTAEPEKTAAGQARDRISEELSEEETAERTRYTPSEEYTLQIRQQLRKLDDQIATMQESLYGLMVQRANSQRSGLTRFIFSALVTGLLLAPLAGMGAMGRIMPIANGAGRFFSAWLIEGIALFLVMAINRQGNSTLAARLSAIWRGLIASAAHAATLVGGAVLMHGWLVQNPGGRLVVLAVAASLLHLALGWVIVGAEVARRQLTLSPLLLQIQELDASISDFHARRRRLERLLH